ncbi:tRNA (adenine-N1)-methyltransferase [Micrococcus terreus]|uniref:tRNA (adenine-N1)-methyltransferase n=1 Tax=Micrococcus terreus TaxID=574650 RepID=UPI00254C542C|nr:tRNA (adenine-N1)-methyltransferase [Micrococcus terreus]MDK7699917.1 tRNA (adenine-N1)-methyltransferase [Micrococcus terreus]WOO98307.1 tRNA (adenine-N1)-methyltransferase [Micrococcus terreus]
MTSTEPTHSAPRPAAPATGASARRGPLREGQRVQIKDAKGRMNTITLARGGQFHSYQGVLRHDDLIGGPEGVVVQNSSGHEYQVLRPLLNDFVLSMPRGATVVYPKDAGQIVQLADIYPGATVVEAGVGSGALSISLLRAVGDSGRLHSYERRPEFAEIAQANVTTFFGAEHPAWQVHLKDAQQMDQDHEPGSVDRVVLDMLAPWECLDAVATVLAPGGVWLNYIATATQMSRVAEAIREDGRFTPVEASETMVRGWHLDGLAVRPDHRMVAHTGFLMTCRRLATGQEAMLLKKRSKVSEFSAEDTEAWLPSDETRWTPQALGERTVTDKKARKSAREAASMAERSVRAASETAPQGPTTAGQ